MAETFNSLDILTHLIRLVENAPNLYDSARKGYRDPTLKRRSWANIAASMGLTATECKAEWEKIREKYTKQFKRIRAERSGVGASIVDNLRLKWPVFDMLRFLEPHVQARKRKLDDSEGGHSPDIVVTSIHCLDNDDTDYGTTGNQRANTTEGEAEVATGAFNSDFAHLAHRVPPGDDFQSEEQHVLAKKPKKGGAGVLLPQQQPQPNLEDDSFHFALSLVPTIRSLDEQQRCTAKLKIMEILHDIKYKNVKS